MINEFHFKSQDYEQNGINSFNSEKIEDINNNQSLNSSIIMPSTNSKNNIVYIIFLLYLIHLLIIYRIKR